MDNANGNILDFTPANAITDSFKIKDKITGEKGNDSSEDVEIMVPLKYLSNFWRTLKMPWINCKIDLDLNWCASCIIVATTVVNQRTTFSLTDIKLYITVIFLSIQVNAKLLEQINFDLKRIINWNKY